MNSKCVYRHRRLDNFNVFYIGIGTINRAYSKLNRNKHWKNVVNCCGYVVEILVNGVSADDAKELEILLISEYGLCNLTNYTEGGDGINGYRHTKETKKMLSDFQKGKRKGSDNSFYGKKHTKESRGLISDAGCKKVIDTSNGKIYRSAKDAAIILGYPNSTLTKYLNGWGNNKTTLKYYERKTI